MKTLVSAALLALALAAPAYGWDSYQGGKNFGLGSSGADNSTEMYNRTQTAQGIKAFEDANGNGGNGGGNSNNATGATSNIYIFGNDNTVTGNSVTSTNSGTTQNNGSIGKGGKVVTTN